MTRAGGSCVPCSPNTHCQEALPKEPPVLPNCYIVFRKLPKAINSLRDNEYIGVRPEEVNQLFFFYLKEHLHKLVVFAPVTFRDEDGFAVQTRCAASTSTSYSSRLKPENCARQGNTSEGQRNQPTLRTVSRHPAKYPASPLCLPHRHGQQHPAQTDSPSPAMSKTIWTCSPNSPFWAANAGMVHATKGYRTHPKELKVIQKMGFCAYFLITWDIIRYATSAATTTWAG